MPSNVEPCPGTGPVVVTVEEPDWPESPTHRFSFKRLFQFMGPGILMSIAYVDPGNLESDLQVGAQAGYVLLWLLLLSTFMGLLVQMQAAKLGVVTGRHLAQHCRQQYPPLPRIILWLMAEIAIIGSDIQEVIGSAIALALLSGGRLPLWAGVLLTAVDSFALLFIERLGIRVLEGFFAAMVGVMVGTFGVMYADAEVPSGDVIRGFAFPTLPRKDLPVAVALMGSLIMPHNIYLHSALVQTRRLASDRPAAKREALTYFGIESALSLVVAVVINLFITAVFAAGFYGADLPDIGLQNAGRYLGDTYGQPVVYIWALGLLAAGQSSTMTGTYTGQFVMGGYLDLQVSPWARVAITRAVAIAPTLVVALLCGRGDGNQLDQLNQGLNLLQSIQLPFALVPVLTFTSSPAIMGQFANSSITSLVCWAIAGLVVLINGLAVYEVAYEAVVADPWVTGTALTVLTVLYLALILYLVIGPQSQISRCLGWSWACCGGKASGAGSETEPLLGQEDRAEAGEAEAEAPAGCTKAACGCCAGCRCWETTAEPGACGKGVVSKAVVAEVLGSIKVGGGGKAAGGEGVAVASPVTPAACCGCRQLGRGGSNGSSAGELRTPSLSDVAEVLRGPTGQGGGEEGEGEEGEGGREDASALAPWGCARAVEAGADGLGGAESPGLGREDSARAAGGCCGGSGASCSSSSSPRAGGE